MKVRKERDNSPEAVAKREKAKSTKVDIQDAFAQVVKRGDTVNHAVYGDEIEVKKVNKKSITSTSGERYTFDELSHTKEHIPAMMEILDGKKEGEAEEPTSTPESISHAWNDSRPGGTNERSRERIEKLAGHIHKDPWKSSEEYAQKMNGKNASREVINGHMRDVHDLALIPI